MVNKAGSIPLYKQIAESLTKKIKEGKFKSGKLPSEKELCETYFVSRISIRQAIKILEQNGIVYSVQGKGTYIYPVPIRQSLMHVTNFEKTLQEKGLKGSTVILSFDKHIASKPKYRTHKTIEIKNANSLKLLGLGDGNPIVYYHSMLRGDIGSSMCELAFRMSAEGIAYSTLDLYALIQKPIFRIEQEIFAENASSLVSSLLKNGQNDAVLRLESLIYDEDDSIMEHKIGFYRSDIYSFQILRSL